MEGEVVAVFGRHYRVQVGDVAYQCFTRGKRSDVACGDKVKIKQQSLDQGVIEQVLERSNLLYRSDPFRQKLIAANIDQIVLVVATEPTFSLDLVSRTMVAAEVAGTPLIIVLNKSELPSFTEACARIAPLAGLGYVVIQTSFKTQPEQAVRALLPILANKTSVILGQSGMGKSTLVNLLVPNARIPTQEISTRLDSGKHTTTFAQIYPGVCEGQAYRLVDSPGFQEFGLAHLTHSDLENAFVEFRRFLGDCRFYNCQHFNEPDCAVRTAAERGEISHERMGLYRRLRAEI